MLNVSKLFWALVAVAVALAVWAVWQFAFTGGGQEKKQSPDAARIDKLRRDKNVAALGNEVAGTNVEVARQAVGALGRVGSEAMEQVKRAMRDPRPRVREKAVTVFAQVARREDAAPLAELARKDGSPDVRAAAISGLERMYAFDEMETILGAMEDPDVVVRRRAAAAATRFACAVVGFKADDPPEKRKAAVEQMRAVWNTERDRARRYWEMILRKHEKLK
jgi:HEAT repeat protein